MSISFLHSKGTEAPIEIPAIGLDPFVRMPPSASAGEFCFIETINAPGAGPPGIATAPALLDSYDAERRPVGAQVIEASGRMTRMATLANPVLEHLRDVAVHVLLGLAPVQRAMTGQMAEVSIGYPHSPLNGPFRGDAPAGSRVRPVVGEVPFGAGGTPLFAMQGSAGAAELASRFPGLVETQPRPFGGDGLITLVRSDGYRAAQVPGEDWQALVPYLQQLRAG